MSATLFILNDPPYGTERTYNGLRLAISLAKQEGEKVRIFLIGDAVSSAKRGQMVPQGHYNVDVMLRAIIKHNGEIGVCCSCMDARGITDAEIEEGCHRSSMEELAAWTLAADPSLVF